MNKELIKQTREYLKENNLSINQLSQQLQRHKSNVFRFLNGSSCLNKEGLEKLKRIILSGKENKKEDKNKASGYQKHYKIEAVGTVLLGFTLKKTHKENSFEVIYKEKIKKINFSNRLTRVFYWYTDKVVVPIEVIFIILKEFDSRENN